jgi:4,5-dihydroxyphthalate decarboxylase
VRNKEFDFGELAIVTYLQARSFGTPYVLLPATVVGRGQHHTIAYNPENGALRPQDLNGRRVGVRAYSVTTTTWVRGILARDYGVDLDSVKWVTFEDPHVAEYKDPPTATRAPAGKEIAKMLLDGELDAAVVGDKLPDPRLRTLIPDAEVVARAWAASRGGVPINHMAVVRDAILKSRPDVVQELYRLLLESKRAARMPTDGTPEDPIRFGIEQNRKALELIIDLCVEQKLIARPFTVDELFADTRQLLGL